MAEDGPYEIMPYKEIVELKKEIRELRSKSSEINSKKLMESIEGIAEQTGSIMKILKAASEEMGSEEKGGHASAEKTDSLIRKLDTLIEQNKTIAEGMVAVADMIKEHMENANRAPKHFLRPVPKQRPNPEPFQQGMPAPDSGAVKGPAPSHTPPMPMPAMKMPPSVPGKVPNMMGGKMPPSVPGNEPLPELNFPEPEKPKKKGLFSHFKK